jgi:hypothetical protein
MSMMSRRYFLILTWLPVTILLAVALAHIGCFNPRNLPAFKRAAEEQERKMVKYTDEALKESPVLQELDRLCTKDIPLPDGFRLVSRTGTPKKRNPYLSYHYYSGAGYKGIKSFYDTYFSQNGWRVTENREGGWGPPWHAVFRKDNYLVAVTYGGKGKEVNYSLFCQKVFEEDE